MNDTMRRITARTTATITTTTTTDISAMMVEENDLDEGDKEEMVGRSKLT